MLVFTLIIVSCNLLLLFSCNLLLLFSFALKNYCQDLLKTHSGRLALKMRGQLFLRHLIEYAFVGVALSIGKFMGGEYLNESRNVI